MAHLPANDGNDLTETADARPELLIVDDDPLITEAFAYVLETDFRIIATDTRGSAIRSVRALATPPPLALVDLGLPPTPHQPDEGFALITELLAHAPDIRIIVLSGQSELAHARHARALGALEYLPKPVDPERLRSLLLSALEVEASSPLASEAADGPALRGDSDAIRALRSQIDQLADAPFPVLIEGESGTGKELVAQDLHRLSSRREAPYLTLNCAAISPSLIESLLFGHTKGSFTGATGSRAGYFEEAGNGTLFLDEIGELPLELQPKLLRVLENGEFHRVGETRPRYSRARVITATNRDLKQAIRAGGFRADLYHRLSVFALQMPALRFLAEDRLRLMRHFRQHVAAQTGAAPFELDPEAKARWLAYDFPGNVRELRNITIRLQTKFGGCQVGVADLEAELDVEPRPLASATGTPPTPLEPDDSDPTERAMRELQASEGFELDATLRRWEVAYIEAALRIAQGRMSQAARLLGVNRSTLYSRMSALGIDRGPAGDGV
ncbi:MAG: sigma-54-dependent Fis family transcriptional regulator [Rhodocyclaceae bacterium]|nr:sigma-54-dependent Fis family transcriptional regulator [Rhodocyclaceae bacterium]